MPRRLSTSHSSDMQEYVSSKNGRRRLWVDFKVLQSRQHHPLIRTDVSLPTPVIFIDHTIPEPCEIINLFPFAGHCCNPPDCGFIPRSKMRRINVDVNFNGANCQVQRSVKTNVRRCSTKKTAEAVWFHSVQITAWIQAWGVLDLPEMNSVIHRIWYSNHYNTAISSFNACNLISFPPTCLCAQVFLSVNILNSCALSLLWTNCNCVCVDIQRSKLCRRYAKGETAGRVTTQWHQYWLKMETLKL